MGQLVLFFDGSAQAVLTFSMFTILMYIGVAIGKETKGLGLQK